VQATTYGHQICVIDAFDMNAKTSGVDSGLTYVSRSQRSKRKIIIWIVNQGGTNRNCCTRRIV